MYSYFTRFLIIAFSSPLLNPLVVLEFKVKVGWLKWQKLENLKDI